MRTLVLNAGYEPMHLVSWQRALCLVLSQKAEVIAEHNDSVRTVSQAFRLPLVVRLRCYVRMVRHFGFVRCTRKNILTRDNFQCQYCGVKCRPGKITIDHIIPKSRGGKTVWENVVAACYMCNHLKGSKALEVAGLKLLSRPRRPMWQDMIVEYDPDSVQAWLPYLALAG